MVEVFYEVQSVLRILVPSVKGFPVNNQQPPTFLHLKKILDVQISTMCIHFVFLKLLWSLVTVLLSLIIFTQSLLKLIHAEHTFQSSH